MQIKSNVVAKLIENKVFYNYCSLTDSVFKKLASDQPAEIIHTS